MADENGEKRRKRLKTSHTESSQHSVPAANGSVQVFEAGKIKKIQIRNFMCHDNLEIALNPNVNFITGRNGSGKSAILTALTIALGARASTTQRGNSLKDFIKKDHKSAVIEVTIINEGARNYKPEEYGKTITVVRTLGSGAGYKIKSESGKIISTKKEELENLLSMMNIQVENPISVLNQDVARSFLTTGNASDKYKLFMQATQMDLIGENYREAQQASEEARKHLQSAVDYMAKSKEECHDLEKQLEMLDSVDTDREQVQKLTIDLAWAHVMAEEKKLRDIEAGCKVEESELEKLEKENDIEKRQQELDDKIKVSQGMIEEIRAETEENQATYDVVKEKALACKSAYTDRYRDLKNCQSQIRRTQDGIASIVQEIKRLEAANDKAAETAEIQENLTKHNHNLEEVEAMLSTKQTEHLHLTTDKQRLEQEEHTISSEVNRCENLLRRSNQQLISLKQQTDNAMTVFGVDMPRLLKRIDEEYSKGRFRQKPIGPLGALIKVKDPAWTPAIEAYLGPSTLTSFRVDNPQDAKVLQMIMKEIMRGERPPQVISGPFRNEIYNVSETCVRHPNYKNLLELLDISNPNVVNCLIDMRGVEGVLLIPTSAEAEHLLSDSSRVPANCQRGWTQKGEDFYPDPNYKSYGGKVGRPKYLQVSTKDAIQSLEDEIYGIQEDFNAARNQHRIIRDKLQRNRATLSELTQQISKLRSMQQKEHTAIKRLSDQLEEIAPNTITIDYSVESEVLEKKLTEHKEEEARISADVDEKRKALEDMDTEVKRRRIILDNMNTEMDKVKSLLRKLNGDKDKLRQSDHEIKSRLAMARKALDKIRVEYDTQKRVVDKTIANAESLGPRREVDKSIEKIKKTISHLVTQMNTIVQKIGTREELSAQLQAKREKYQNRMVEVERVSAVNDRHLARVKKRRLVFKRVKRCIGERIQVAFSGILDLRQFKGSVNIDHTNKTLELVIIPRCTANSQASSSRSLSGGERSYSTVAFILALWECTRLPFYFLDEFDVFMDKVNRRIILDILLGHTREHPECQFTFLTPLDTGVSLLDNYITIHELQPPERGNNAG